ncbi:amidase family protein [Mycoplasma tauri]|uniref:amidase family protein n=1 Tax=Mycoplasma tauri TaxID=547987 RepID=UPI001CC08A80|nr:amidase family protein [Mycoplasma tauri]MBZ4204199.1 Asp-tRNA(Asn)/Glu-tRNA(Gln) amidotransferase GatCAB subunit A [Mycoplasma tauri]
MKFIKTSNFEEALNEIKNDKNNCLAALYEKKTTSVSGILSNTVFTIKDNYATKDKITTASSLMLKNFKPLYNATIIDKLLHEGANPVAKVYCDELALGGTGKHSAFGLIRNPHDKERLAGGSSSGSVATFTDKISFSIGSDTGDSVRLPGSFNGVPGFKPSYGAISRYGLFSFASSLDTVAFFAHNVNDIAVISQVLFGKDDKDMTSLNIEINNIEKTKPEKIGVLDVTGLEEFVSLEYKKLVDVLSKQTNIEMIKPDEDLLRAIKPVYEIISFSEASSNLANLSGIGFGTREFGKNWEEIMTNSRSEGFGKMVQIRLALGSFFLHSENQEEMFLKAQKVRRLIKNYYDDLHRKYDIIIYPASSDVAPFIDDTKNKDHGYMEYILTGANLVGNPSLSLPWIKKDNLFVNLSIDSLIYTDKKLLSYALWLEDFLRGDKNE